MNKAFKLYNGNCLDLMRDIPDASIDLILCDLPYGTTQNKWDTIIPFEQLWTEYLRIIKPKGNIILMANQPFTSMLVVSNTKLFKYSLVWNKVNRITGHLNAKKQPLRITEDILVFYKKLGCYNPQMTQGSKAYTVSGSSGSSNYGATKKVITVNDGSRYPTNIINIRADRRSAEGRLHPTQKPVELMEYLIKTYSNKNDIVLDNTMGPGTTGVACMNLRRKFIGMELDTKYFKIAETRIKQAYEDQKEYTLVQVKIL